jgi:hypothetical protein
MVEVLSPTGTRQEDRSHIPKPSGGEVTMEKRGFKRTFVYLNRLIGEFERLHRAYPDAGFLLHVYRLRSQRAELVDTIGQAISHRRRHKQ